MEVVTRAVIVTITAAINLSLLCHGTTNDQSAGAEGENGREGGATNDSSNSRLTITFPEVQISEGGGRRLSAGGAEGEARVMQSDKYLSTVARAACRALRLCKSADPQGHGTRLCHNFPRVNVPPVSVLPAALIPC